MIETKNALITSAKIELEREILTNAEGKQELSDATENQLNSAIEMIGVLEAVLLENKNKWETIRPHSYKRYQMWRKTRDALAILSVWCNTELSSKKWVGELFNIRDSALSIQNEFLTEAEATAYVRGAKSIIALLKDDSLADFIPCYHRKPQAHDLIKSVPVEIEAAQ